MKNKVRLIVFTMSKLGVKDTKYFHGQSAAFAACCTKLLGETF